MKRLFLPLLVTSAIVTACSNDDDVIYSADGQTTGVSFTIEPLTVADESAATRTDVSVSVLGPSITWALADTLGVFPVNGYPTAFPISASVGEKSAVFDGGDWALRPSTSYAAYYPFSIRHLNRSAIPAVYSGQVQRGNGDTRHLGAYGYMAAAYSEVNAEGNVDFKMANLGALLCFELTVPEADTFTSFTGEASSDIFTQTATYDVTAARPSLTPVSRTSSFSLALDGVSVASASDKVVLYAWVAPVACKDKTLTFTLVGQKHTYTATAGGDDLVANSYHKYPLTLEVMKSAPAAAEAVDLGLIVDGKKVLWANMNVGAESPTDYGGYFAWGETVPYGGVDESNAMNYSYAGSYNKTYYSWDAYKYCKGEHSTLTKYVPSIASEYGYNGFYDNKIMLDPEDDAATANWGAEWRMPTHAEQQALCNQCTWTWITSYNGNSVNGYKVSGNGHEIFLPAAGYYHRSSSDNVGSYGYYWSSSFIEETPYFAMPLAFGSSSITPDDPLGSRSFGFSMRPVRAAQEYSVLVSSLSLNKTTLTLNPDATETLTVSVTPSNAESHVTWTSSDESVATVDERGVVTAKKAGITVIRATTIDGTGKFAVCVVTVKGQSGNVNGHEWVDLGVEVDGKRILWATTNVGAKSPKEYGGLFAWGETVPYGGVDESNATNYSYTHSYTKTDFSWYTYKYMTSGINYWTGITKYTYPDGQTSGVWYKNGTFVGDRKTVLDPEDDAATANWGADWRMPTHAEQEALYSQCTWTWVTSYYGESVNGYKVSGNGCEIFLPAAGYRYNSYPPNRYSGYYWSSSLKESGSDEAWWLQFSSGGIIYLNSKYYYRNYGFSVRPVRTAPN